MNVNDRRDVLLEARKRYGMFVSREQAKQYEAKTGVNLYRLMMRYCEQTGRAQFEISDAALAKMEAKARPAKGTPVKRVLHARVSRDPQKALRKATEKEARRQAHLPVVVADGRLTTVCHNPFSIDRTTALNIVREAVRIRKRIEERELEEGFVRPAKQVSEEFSSHITTSAARVHKTFQTDGGDNNKPDLFDILLSLPLEVKVTAQNSWLGVVGSVRAGWYILVRRDALGWFVILVDMTHDDLWVKTTGMAGKSVLLKDLYRFVCEHPEKVDLLVGTLTTTIWCRRTIPHVQTEAL